MGNEEELDAVLDEARRKADLVQSVIGARQVWAVVQHDDGAFETVMYRPTAEAIAYMHLHLHRTMAEIEAASKGGRE